MKHVPLIFSMMMIAASAQASEVERVCAELRGAAEDMARQLPMRIDAMTTITAATAALIRGRCQVRFAYVVDGERFIQEASAHIERTFSPATRADAETWLRSPDGIRVVREQVASIIHPDLLEIGRLPFVDMSFSYRFIGGTIPSFDHQVR